MSEIVRLKPALFSQYGFQINRFKHHSAAFRTISELTIQFLNSRNTEVQIDTW